MDYERIAINRKCKMVMSVLTHKEFHPMIQDIFKEVIEWFLLNLMLKMMKFLLLKMHRII